MGNYVASNNAASTLVGPITASATTLSVQVADASKFPTVNNGGVGADYSMLTLQDSANNIEIVKVTRHDAGASSFTVTRGQEGTTARAWNTGDTIACRLTAGVVTDSFVAASGAAASAAASTASASSAAASASTATTTANSALTKADSALTGSANDSTARTSASNAQATANSASTALSGSANDSTARTAASNAQSTANTAVTKADSAQTTANNASAAASAAQSTANNALSQANSYTGTVTAVATGNGLVGGTITSSGTISLDVYNGSAPAYASYPVGTVVQVLNTGGTPLINTTTAIYSPPSGGGIDFSQSNQGSGSAVLAGTWRYRGRGGNTGCYPTFLAQRTA